MCSLGFITVFCSKLKKKNYKCHQKHKKRQSSIFLQMRVWHELVLVHNPISNNTALKLTNLTPKQLTKENYFCLTIFLNSYAVMQQLIQKLLLAKTKKTVVLSNIIHSLKVNRFVKISNNNFLLFWLLPVDWSRSNF